MKKAILLFKMARVPFDLNTAVSAENDSLKLADFTVKRPFSHIFNHSKTFIISYLNWTLNIKFHKKYLNEFNQEPQHYLDRQVN